MVSKKVLGSFVAVIGVATSLTATLVVKSNEWFSNSSINLINSKLNTEVTTNELQPFEQFNESPILSQKTGPIISWGSEIKSLDWFGAVRWKINLLEHKELFPQEKTTNLVEYRNRAFISWDLDVTNNILWLLMNTSKDTTTIGWRRDYANILASKVVKINSLTGSIDKVYEWKEKDQPKKFKDYWSLYYQISALRDGNVLLFSQVEGTNRKSVVLNTTTGEFNEHSEKGDSVEAIVIKGQTKNRREVRNIFLVPIANNLNILAVLDFNSHGQRTTSNATGDIYLLLVDDKLAIHNTTDEKWKKFIHIPNVFSTWNSRDADPVINRSIYRTFDNKVYFTIYNKFFVVDTKLNDKQGLDFAEYDLANSGTNATNTTLTRPKNTKEKVNAISSYAIDANENVYYKLINDSTIYNLKISVDKSNVKNTTFASTTYYNIAQNSNEAIKNSANTFVLFNVTGSTGALFALNAKVINNGEQLTNQLQDYEKHNYGLALAIVPSASNPNVGDVKGLLNTKDKFIKPADFEIETSTLNQKLPSEITRNDLKLLNDGFFTNNKELNKDGSLKYLPFEIKDIDDEKGTFTAIAHLDQIPWFANSLPNDFVPRKIEKKFQNASTIDKKVGWIKQDNLGYDFLNTLPSKVTVEDLNSFDLFQANFASQTITSSNQVIYPKKTYSVTKQEDQTGTIEVNVKYEYVPLGVNYSSSKDVITYTSKQEYKIFKSSDSVKLTFAGQKSDNDNSFIDIKNTPVLKSFLQTSILPSSIQALIDSNQIKYTDFLNLANSTGYPTNKMKFSLKANDENGTLVFSAQLPEAYYDSTKQAKLKFEQTFSGFNTSSNYSFKFKDDLKNIKINKAEAKSFLPSSITQANVLANFLEFSGFDAKDLNINLKPNDISGSLTIEVKLNPLYSQSIGNNETLGFKNYLATKSFSGFLTQKEFNKQFNVEFHNNNDEAISSIKQKTLLEIYDGLVEQNNDPKTKEGLSINDVKYTNLNELIEKLLVKSKGNQIPSDWKDKTDKIQTKMVFDNNAGTVAFFVTIKANTTPNINTDLNFVVSYNDFARGNKTPTDDNLSFVSNSNFNQFKVNNEQEKISLNNLGSFLSDKQNVKKLFSSLTGQYQALIQEDKYDISVIGFPLFNSARIEINFKDVTNKQSLKTYSNTFVFEQ